MGSPKKRLDQILMDRQFTETRQKAQALILAGKVYTTHQCLDKAGMLLDPDIYIFLKDKGHPWASRGGVKLKHAIEIFSPPIEEKICMDIGASTGGFTDVLLHYGAQKVYAIDVGHSQLHNKLLKDPRVVSLEKHNARHLTTPIIPKIDGLVCDASFISLKTVLPNPLKYLKDHSWMILLIKPQFEAGKQCIGKKGVVSDPKIHEHVCQDISEWINKTEKWVVQGICTSPLTGPQGNKEFFIFAHSF